MHLRLEAFWRRIDIERRMVEGGIGQRAKAGNRIEGAVGVHVEIWTRVVEARVEAKWLSKVVVVLQMGMLDGKHLKSGAPA